MGIIGIFQQNMHFCNFLVVLGVRVQALVICGATCKMASKFGGLNCNFFKK
jgi:hypothetical protein